MSLLVWLLWLAAWNGVLLADSAIVSSSTDASANSVAKNSSANGTEEEASPFGKWQFGEQMVSVNLKLKVQRYTKMAKITDEMWKCGNSNYNSNLV